VASTRCTAVQALAGILLPSVISPG